MKRRVDQQTDLLNNEAAKTPPEFYRLPIRGGDPYFGLRRSWYYKAEKEGRITLVRLRQRGKVRGVVLVPYDAVKRLIAETGE